MKIDMHTHTIYSKKCGYMEPKKLIQVAIKKGLDGIAITDHNTIKGGVRAKEYETENFEVIVGSEIMTDRGEVIGLYLDEEINNKSNNIYDVISEIKEQNGIVIIPHPFDKLRHSAFNPTKNDVNLIDCVEGFNSRCVFQNYNVIAVEFGTEHNLVITAGSDAHFFSEIGNAGVITDRDDLRESIRRGNIEIFGKKSAITNHVKTKLLKFKRGVYRGHKK